MTATEFIAKFPKATKNQDALEDIACPSCGQRESFRVEAIIIAILRDEGSDRDESDCEYDGGAYCECGDYQCRFHGTLADFTIEGLDALLE